MKHVAILYYIAYQKLTAMSTPPPHFHWRYVRNNNVVIAKLITYNTRRISTHENVCVKFRDKNNFKHLRYSAHAYKHKTTLGLSRFCRDNLPLLGILIFCYATDKNLARVFFSCVYILSFRLKF